MTIYIPLVNIDTFLNQQTLNVSLTDVEKRISSIAVSVVNIYTTVDEFSGLAFVGRKEKRIFIFKFRVVYADTIFYE